MGNWGLNSELKSCWLDYNYGVYYCDVGPAGWGVSSDAWLIKVKNKILLYSVKELCTQLKIHLLFVI